MKVFVYITLSLLAFAANSILCRLALGNAQIDAASFTSIRLISGVITLAIVILLFSKKYKIESKGNWTSGFMLFVYAVSFSYAYITLDTATGALILFATVQITIILTNLIKGNKLHCSEWLGTVIAFSGFIYLILPELTTPSAVGFVLMGIAGIAWGCYTLLGKNSSNPIHDTAYNFIRTIPMVIILMLISFPQIDLTTKGLILAIMSGAVASGVGYTIWYMALSNMSSTFAAVVQLLVPVLASLGGVLFVSEQLTLRLIVSGGFILGGIFLVVIGPQYFMNLNKKIL